MSTNRDNTLTLSKRNIRPHDPSEARVAHRGCHTTGSRALAAPDAPTLPGFAVTPSPRPAYLKPVADNAPATPPKRQRMNGLYGLKPWFTRRLTPIVNAAVARKVSPDVFTVAGVVAAAAAGVVVALGWWPLAALFLVLRLAGANLDGAVARARGVRRPWGFVVNQLGDRASDLLTFAGLAVWAARQRARGCTSCRGR